MPRATGTRLRTLRAGLAATLTIGLVGAGLAMTASSATAAADPTDVASYAPAGTVNLAPSARVTASSSQGGLAPDVLNDGNSGSPDLNVWVAADTGVDAGGFVQVDLRNESAISRIVVFPRGDADFYGVYYPTEFTVTVTDAGGQNVFEQRITHEDDFDGVVSEPDVIDLEAPVDAVSVRIDVITRQSREGGILQFSEIAVFGTSTEIPDYQPAGTENLSVTSRVTASSSYEKPDESWAAAFAIDGDVGRTSGWSTDPYEKVQDPHEDATLTLALRCESEVARAVVFPRTKAFPRDYRIEVSADGTQWTPVAESVDNPADQSDPQVFDMDPGTMAHHVRLVTDVRNGPAGVDGYLVQLAEFAVYGTSEGCIGSVKPALLLEPGASDSHWFEDFGGDTGDYAVSSSDEAVATVAPDGTITAVASGTATVTLVSGETTLSVPVEVAEEVERIGDDFMITVFWAPLPEYVNDEQYDYLANAGIDVVQASQLTATPAVNHEMARLAHERGMQTIVQDENASGRFTTMTPEQAAAWAQRYTNIPGVGGFYLVDEPLDATAYATAFNAIREAAPEYYSHLNFFPYSFYGSEEANDAAMQAWLDATGPRTIDDRDYLMYDLYPFQEGGTGTASLLTNLNTVRELGLENQVKTAMYLQSIGIPGNLRRPVPAEIRYEANLALAYGYKQLSYFTWWTPTDRGEPFTDGIMTADGEPTDLYAPVTQLNSEIHALGPTLMGLDATEVYVAGTAHGQEPVPADFFVQPRSDADLVLSHLVERAGGEDYLFVVNNSFTGSHEAVLEFADPSVALQEVSRADGSLGREIELPDGTLTRELAPSEGVLYKVVDPSEQPGDGDDGSDGDGSDGDGSDGDGSDGDGSDGSGSDGDDSAADGADADGAASGDDDSAGTTGPGDADSGAGDATDGSGASGTSAGDSGGSSGPDGPSNSSDPSDPSDPDAAAGGAGSDTANGSGEAAAPGALPVTGVGTGLVLPVALLLLGGAALAVRRRSSRSVS
ncbi:discoidin domain-containing protein [Pseudactinotalea sp. HY158]|uniref:discoidin domain-containing protein n=1 Tax=Pseudactinotalea sp. HY158 TaxID=2654547 RepID=UPI00129C4A91|nr:discoidin domain-containing protein [Pseudactinotalea sp. HY158]QGH69926.1 hypothetical protein GCE65_10725 [Pseudactinotalea sp. HY158]